MNQKFNKISKKFNNFKNDPRTKKLKNFLNNSNGEKIIIKIQFHLLCPSGFFVVYSQRHFK